MNRNNDEIMRDFQLALKRMLGTPDGEKVLDTLTTMYVDSSCLGDTPEMTYYRLGQKEFVQSLIKEVSRESDEIENFTANRGEA